MKNLIGKRVKQARNSLNPRITQDQLAARLQLQGVSLERAAISKFEIGIRPVTDIELVAIAKALGTTVAWLVGESEIVQNAEPMINENE